jgi:hypothetical protein
VFPSISQIFTVVYSNVSVVMSILTIVGFIYNSNFLKIQIIKKIKGKKLELKFY